MIRILPPQHKIHVTINTGGSKSISNRLLMFHHIFSAETPIENLSSSEDTNLLATALATIKENKQAVIDVHHAGTDFRFLTALLAVTEGEWILTGSERIRQRPITELVSALKALGADISYVGENGFPPLKINGKKLSGGTVEIDAGVSSQFISALLLIAPKLENGLNLHLKGEIVSWPYIQMTISILKSFGVKVNRPENTINVSFLKDQNHLPNQVVESDWSSASYWYSICALSPGAEIALSNLKKDSLQADAVLPKLFEKLGVETIFQKDGIVLKNQKRNTNTFEHDFSSCPDIAQTLTVTCFGLGIPATLTGLKTLKLKETDRIAALKMELEKFGAVVHTTSDQLTIEASPGTLLSQTNSNKIFDINTYQDHRMAMSFAPLSLVFNNLIIRDPDVVHKSYPAFWSDLQSAGFNVNLQS